MKLTAPPTRETPKVARERPVAPRAGRRPIAVAVRWILVLAVLAAVAVGISRWTQRPIPVSTSIAVRSEIWGSFTAEGVVRGREYAVSGEGGGRVATVLVREGEAVRRGQVLLELNSDPARAQVAEMEAAYRSALDTVAQARAERAQLLRRAQNAESAARARLAQAQRQAELVKRAARPEQLAQAAQAVARARAAHDEAAKALTRAESLFAAGAIARATLENAQTAEAVAKADLRQAEAAEALMRAGPTREELAVAEAGVASAEVDLASALGEMKSVAVADEAIRAATARSQQAKAALLRARSALQSQSVRSPTDGTVTRLYVEPGAVIVPGFTALVISTREDLRIEAEVSTEDSAKLHPGMDVEVYAAAYPGRTFPAQVRSVMPAGELKPDAAIRTRIVRARIELAQDSNRFRPGMEVDVEGRAQIGSGIVIPNDAVRYSGDAVSVYVVADRRVVERPIRTGTQNAEVTEVVAGLQAGDEVIVRGKDQVFPGARVRVEGR